MVKCKLCTGQKHLYYSANITLAPFCEHLHRQHANAKLAKKKKTQSDVEAELFQAPDPQLDPELQQRQWHNRGSDKESGLKHCCLHFCLYMLK